VPETGRSRLPSRQDGVLQVPWSRSQRTVARRIVQPLQSFLETEASSGALLLGAAVIALAWANSPWSESYETFWTTTLGVRAGDLVIEADLRDWVNDGLMSLFFLVVGLEVKRELATGELRERRAASLPVVAALGGMVIPALLYLAVTAGTNGASGWGAAMPTDLAFAIGLMALAMPRGSRGLRVFLLTLALADDIGSIVVVSIAYAGDVIWAWLAAALAVGLVIAILQRIHVRATPVYVALGVIMWLVVREAGVSPTVVGAALGFLTPAVPFQRPRAVSDEAHRVADATVDDPYPPDADAPQWLRLASLTREAVSPLARVEAALHPWTSFVVAPLFALANAGVPLSTDALAAPGGRRVALAMVLARVIGKPLGISLFVAIAIRAGIARRPPGGSWLHLVGVAAAAGIPFTVSLFVADLALPSHLLDAAKLGIFASWLLAGALAFGMLRASLDAGSERPSAEPSNVT
jgi:Na+:H+ antiporter, NhaA family